MHRENLKSFLCANSPWLQQHWRCMSGNASKILHVSRIIKYRFLLIIVTTTVAIEIRCKKNYHSQLTRKDLLDYFWHPHAFFCLRLYLVKMEKGFQKGSRERSRPNLGLFVALWLPKGESNCHLWSLLAAIRLWPLKLHLVFVHYVSNKHLGKVYNFSAIEIFFRYSHFYLKIIAGRECETDWNSYFRTCSYSMQHHYVVNNLICFNSFSSLCYSAILSIAQLNTSTQLYSA